MKYKYIYAGFLILILVLGFLSGFNLKGNVDLLLFLHFLLFMPFFSLLKKGRVCANEAFFIGIASIIFLMIFYCIQNFYPLTFGLPNFNSTPVDLNYSLLTLMVLGNFLLGAVLMFKAGKKINNQLYKFLSYFIVPFAFIGIVLFNTITNVPGRTILDRSLSPNGTYETWNVDFGGSISERGGIHCKIVEVKNYVVFAVFREIDPNQYDLLPTDLKKNCGA